MGRVVIVDVDGTVALRGGRSPYDFSRVAEDQPNKSVVELVKVLAESVSIIFLSGRDDSCKDTTRKWLDYHVGVPFELFMRQTGDNRKDAIVKAEIFEREVQPRHDVWLVLDDRNQVVEMWREKGLTCLQVADGDF